MINNNVTLGEMREEISYLLKEYRFRKRVFHGFPNLCEEIKTELLNLTGIEKDSGIDIYITGQRIGLVCNDECIPLFSVVKRTKSLRTINGIEIVRDMFHHLCIVKCCYYGTTGKMTDFDETTTLETVLEVLNSIAHKHDVILAQMATICSECHMSKDQLTKLYDLCSSNPAILNKFIANYDEYVRR